MRITFAALALTALTACSTRPPVPETQTPVGAADTCGAAPYLYLVGEDATALERVLILRQVRVNWPQDVVSEVSKPERINFNIGLDAKIRSVTCG